MRYAAIAAVLGVSCAHEPEQQPPVIVAAKEVPPFRDAEAPQPKAVEIVDAGAPEAEAPPAVVDASAPPKATYADLVAVPVTAPKAPFSSPPPKPPPSLQGACAGHGCHARNNVNTMRVTLGAQPRTGLTIEVRQRAMVLIGTMRARLQACYMNAARADPNAYGMATITIAPGPTGIMVTAVSPSLPASMMECVKGFVHRVVSVDQPATPTTLELKASFTHDTT